MSIEEFIKEVCRQIEPIREHHFITKSQAKFLKKHKSDLKWQYSSIKKCLCDFPRDET